MENKYKNLEAWLRASEPGMPFRSVVIKGTLEGEFNAYAHTGKGDAFPDRPASASFAKLSFDAALRTLDMRVEDKLKKDTEANRAFEEAWAKKVAEGYHYGADALAHVRFGWELAQAEKGEG